MVGVALRRVAAKGRSARVPRHIGETFRGGQRLRNNRRQAMLVGRVLSVDYRVNARALSEQACAFGEPWARGMRAPEI